MQYATALQGKYFQLFLTSPAKPFGGKLMSIGEGQSFKSGFKYKGEDTVANGFAMRVDIHTLFDTGHLRISPDGDVELSGRARLDYGALIPPKIVIPDFTDKENIRWRWDNYNGI